MPTAGTSFDPSHSLCTSALRRHWERHFLAKGVSPRRVGELVERKVRKVRG